MDERRFRPARAASSGRDARSPRRRSAAFAAVGLVATALGVTVLTGATPRATAAAGVARCRTSGLVVWLDTEGSGTAGSIYYKLELTNLSGRSCSLAGYPGVSAVDLEGRRLGDAAARDRSRKPRSVALARGATATAVLQIVDVANFPPAACHRVTAAGLRVYPPNQRTPAIVPFPFPACSRGGTTYLRIRPVRAS